MKKLRKIIRNPLHLTSSVHAIASAHVIALVLVWGIVLTLFGVLLTGCNSQQHMEVQKEANPESQTEIQKEVVTEIETESEKIVASEKSNVQQNNETTVSKRTIQEFLQVGLKPMGTTMYVWGGGWNEEDTAAGIEAVTIGTSPRWAEFAAMQGKNYDYTKTKYQIHDGLDCSGYVGWMVYNILETEDGKEGYVLSSTKMAKNFSDRGLGEYVPAGHVEVFQAGDIMSMDGHVWICLGACKDGSVVIMHSSPPGVALSGTLMIDGSKSEAVQLAETYMKRYYPSWYAKYPNCGKSSSYITTSSCMKWSESVLSDPEGLREMTAEQVLQYIFGEK